LPQTAAPRALTARTILYQTKHLLEWTETVLAKPLLMMSEYSRIAIAVLIEKRPLQGIFELPKTLYDDFARVPEPCRKSHRREFP
jgi:hypothetical protein